MEDLKCDLVWKLKKEIENLTNLVDENIGVQIGENSCAYVDSNDIVVGLYSILHRENKVDLAHEEYYLKNNFNYQVYGIGYETFVILHEIGHLQTAPTKKELKRYLKQNKKIVKSNLTDYEKLIKYFELDLERNADQWAMNYLRNHFFKISKIDLTLNKIKIQLLSLFD